LTKDLPKLGQGPKNIKEEVYSGVKKKVNLVLGEDVWFEDISILMDRVMSCKFTWKKVAKGSLIL
jgi:hypothetical protein